ncbi:hypothetical protein OHA84_07710 [Streptomyces sp. NBC_00513]|uniref:hypothetical protein n=1 Tax=unclassified Streptomyces TaxID=2593676 RepID=UPI00224F8B37|nr:hypothetical protein [Streptomyces sp. NBC_00424]MCX5076567.1 hypothetical protein [Streptomyces sp. NBC_00424]WUD40409.1 hypothetical protein OHA84_07710 [Streptomyces sp. NBC_00513]
MSTARVTAVTAVGATTTGATTAPAPTERRADTPTRSSPGLPRPRRRPAADPARAPRDHHPYRIAEEPHP